MTGPGSKERKRSMVHPPEGEKGSRGPGRGPGASAALLYLVFALPRVFRWAARKIEKRISLLQYQPVPPGNAQAVADSRVLDPDFLIACEEFFRPEHTGRGSLGPWLPFLFDSVLG